MTPALRGMVISSSVIGGLWALMLGIGAIAGVIPPDPVVSPGDAGPRHTSQSAAAYAEPDAGPNYRTQSAAAYDRSSAGAVDDAAPPIEYALGVKARGATASLAVGQLVGDARPELVVGLGDRYEVLALGTGTALTRQHTIRLPPADDARIGSTRRAFIGDVDGDGAADLLLSWHHHVHGGDSRGGAIHMLRGRDGRLGRAARLTLSRVHGGEALAAAHLDADSQLDLVTCASTIRVHGGRGGGRFELGLTHPGHDEDCLAIAADVDGDGRIDAVLSQPDASVMTSSAPAPTALGVRDVHQVVDLDGDGALDLIGIDGRTVTAHLRRGDGYAPRPLRDAGDEELHGAFAVDMNGDGDMELLTLEGWTQVRLVLIPSVLYQPPTPRDPARGAIAARADAAVIEAR